MVATVVTAGGRTTIRKDGPARHRANTLPKAQIQVIIFRVVYNNWGHVD